MTGLSSAKAEDLPLSFTIEAERTNYATTDKVILQLKIRNVSENPVELVDFAQTQSYLLSAGVVRFHIQNGLGEVETLQGPVVDYWPGDRLTTLSKDGTMETKLIINDFDGRNYYRMGKQATYRIYAIYNGWGTKAVISNKIALILD